MRLVLVLLAGLVGLGLAAHLLASARFSRQAEALAERLGEGPPTASVPPLPARIGDAAAAAGAGRGGPARAVRLTQEAELQFSPGAPFEAAPATQTFALGAPGFVWFAEIPLLPLFPKVRVMDAYVGDEGSLSARLFGSVPVANAAGPEISRAQAMRYLAELPWIPDAISGNPGIIWTERPEGWIAATIPLDPVAATVRFRLDDGKIVEMRAEDRPAETLPDGSQVLLDWRALYADYADIGGRRIPTRAEVGYIRDGAYTPYWRGTIIDYQILP